jgi:hypothetical protein
VLQRLGNQLASAATSPASSTVIAGEAVAAAIAIAASKLSGPDWDKPAVGFSVSEATMEKFEPVEDQTLLECSSFTIQCTRSEGSIVQRTVME